MKNNPVSQKRLRELLDYDNVSGIFTWRVTKSNKKSGEVAGSINRWGYIVIGIDRQIYNAHRLVWLYAHGELPSGHVDHINGIKTDNRIVNLRHVSCSENQHNQTRLSANNRSGFKGVSFYKPNGKWRAQIGLRGKRLYLGQYNTAEEAYSAYQAAKISYHPKGCRAIEDALEEKNK